MKKFNAHTMVEVLMTFIVVGVIAGFALTIIKPFDKSIIYLYDRAYQALRLAIYNASLTETGADPIDVNAPFYGGVFPDTPAKFCQALTAYINSSSGCTGSTLPEKLSSGFTIKYGSSNAAQNPDTYFHFIASNGMRFFISPKYTMSSYYDKDDAEVSLAEGSEFSIYFVYVDLNGERGPNSSKYKTGQKNVPDIVVFAVFNSLDVIPLGPPEKDKRLMTAKVDFGSTFQDEDGAEVKYSSPTSFAYAKKYAWGSLVNPEHKMTLDRSIYKKFIPSTSDFYSAPLLSTDAYFVQHPSEYPQVDTEHGCSDEDLICSVFIQEYK